MLSDRGRSPSAARDCGLMAWFPKMALRRNSYGLGKPLLQMGAHKVIVVQMRVGPMNAGNLFGLAR